MCVCVGGGGGSTVDRKIVFGNGHPTTTPYIVDQKEMFNVVCYIQGT